MSIPYWLRNNLLLGYHTHILFPPTAQSCVHGKVCKDTSSPLEVDANGSKHCRCIVQGGGMRKSTPFGCQHAPRHSFGCDLSKTVLGGATHTRDHSQGAVCTRWHLVWLPPSCTIAVLQHYPRSFCSPRYPSMPSVHTLTPLHAMKISLEQFTVHPLYYLWYSELKPHRK